MKNLSLLMLVLFSCVSFGLTAQEKNFSEKEEVISNFTHDPEDEMNTQEEEEENEENEEEEE